MIDHPLPLTWPREVLHSAQFEHQKAAQTMLGVPAAQHGLVAAILYACDPRWWTDLDAHTDNQVADLICRSLSRYLEPTAAACPPVAHWLRLVHTQIAAVAGTETGGL